MRKAVRGWAGPAFEGVEVGRGDATEQRAVGEPRLAAPGLPGERLLLADGAGDDAGLRDASGALTVAVGDTLEATVNRRDEHSGLLVLGGEQGHRLHGHDELERAYADEVPVEGLVTAVTKGGVEAQVAGMRGFCPASQLSLAFVEDLESFVGQRLSFRITRFEGGRRPNLVLSRRSLLEAEQQLAAEQTRAQLEVGAVLPGTVKSLKDFGAFVDLGGIEGMVHISELAFDRVEHPSDILTVGQQVEVQVLRIEKTDNPRQPERIALSIRALAKDPWSDADRDFPVGTRVRGTVTRTQPFGAFVQLAPGIEGLVHISALGAGRRITHPREVVNEGDEVEAVVLAVDMAKHRISLSLDTTAEPEVSRADLDAYSVKPGAGSGTGALGEALAESLRKQESGK